MTVTLIILISLISIYNMPLKYQISYNLKNKSNELNVVLKTLYGLVDYETDLTNLKNKFKNKEKQTIGEYKKSMINSKATYIKYKNMVKYLIDKGLVKELKFNTEYNFEDAAVTGITAGILYSIQSSISLWIYQYTKIENFQFNINPLFKQKNIININFYCIIQFKLGHIIYGSIKHLILYKRR